MRAAVRSQSNAGLGSGFSVFPGGMVILGKCRGGVSSGNPPKRQTEKWFRRYENFWEFFLRFWDTNILVVIYC